MTLYLYLIGFKEGKFIYMRNIIVKYSGIQSKIIFLTFSKSRSSSNSGSSEVKQVIDLDFAWLISIPNAKFFNSSFDSSFYTEHGIVLFVLFFIFPESDLDRSSLI